MSWERFKQYYLNLPALGLSMDVSRMSGLCGKFFTDMAPLADKAFAAMKALEGGAIANPDEGRMVGHYWLRNPA
ncbi:MAG: glucose-6-phosphate isomerase, partial [Opitutales bacterium]